MLFESVLQPSHSELGKKSEYEPFYNPDKLFPISRKLKRDEIGVPQTLPFFGFDLWNHYEVSWLNAKGKPIIALAEIRYGCDTPNLIESKSMKLYFNSFNQTSFKEVESVRSTIQKDLSERVEGPAHVTLMPFPLSPPLNIQTVFEGICLDTLDIECSSYQLDTSTLEVGEEMISETVYSDLLKSNCLVTHQPDWGSVQIQYQGRKINHEGLLRYLISFRNHNEFHEQCIERIFMDIMHCCKPTVLTVYGRYTRRGGLDINPYRTTQNPIPNISNIRLIRQ